MDWITVPATKSYAVMLCNWEEKEEETATEMAVDTDRWVIALAAWKR